MNQQLVIQKQIQDWHDKLRPLLEEEIKKSVYDIHEYGTVVLSCFKSIGEQKSFNDLFGGLNKEEVARYYLSILTMVVYN